MTDSPLTIRLFLSSPGDVAEERALAFQCVERLAIDAELRQKVALQVVAWDAPGAEIPMDAAQSPQDTIDRMMDRPEDCEIVVVIFWSRMGTVISDKYTKPVEYQYEPEPIDIPLKARYFSGTEWEYVHARQQAVQAGYPKLLVYRRTSKYFIDQDDPKSDEKSLQYKRVKRFFTQPQFQDPRTGSIDAGYNLYESPEDFLNKLEQHLRVLIRELLRDPALRRRPGLQSAQVRVWHGDPFPGLESFKESESPVFFGREQEIDALIRKIASSRFVAVVGASGSGKSSLVRAGVLPRLRRNAIAQEADDQRPEHDADARDWFTATKTWTVASKDWLIVTMKPGEIEATRDPFEALYEGFLRALESHDAAAAAFTGILGERDAFTGALRRLTTAIAHLENPAAAQSEALPLLGSMEERDKALAAARREALDWLSAFCQRVLVGRPAWAELLIVMDQFEELFTLVSDVGRSEQALFITLIELLSQTAQVRVLATLRADFYHRCVAYEQLAVLLREGSFTLAAPRLDALYRMITRPADLAMLTFEGDLAERILVETGDNPGALPLMAYLLKELHKRLDGSRLSLRVYEALGGVEGVIGRRAEEIIAALAEQDATIDDALADVFKKLVVVNDAYVPTRSRATKDEITRTSAAAARLLAALTDARLLVTNRDDSGVDIVEVAHEALLTAWPRLAAWIAVRQEDFRIRKQVEDAAKLWADKGGDANYWWTHEQLVPFYEAIERLGYQLDELESPVREFAVLETTRIVAELDDPSLTHERREEIGNRLWELGDPRPGVGVRADGIPDIAWASVQVPAGFVRIQGIETPFEVRPFYIARYPVTYAQFKAFVGAQGGYYNPDWWQGLGVTPFEHKPINQSPENGNRPAEWVSWYQAMAFCAWLSSRLGYEVRLPTEWEWQQAATGGDPSFTYPWGSDWDAGRASTKAGLGHLVAVGLYPHGVSPVGAHDMSGNVYEWCLNPFENPADLRIGTDVPRTTRGGAWYTLRGTEPADVVRTDARLSDEPDSPAKQKARAGFRIMTPHDDRQALGLA